MLSVSGLKRRHGKAVGNAAIAFRMKLLALRQTLMVWLDLWGSHNGKGTEAEDSEQQAQRSETIQHGFRRRES